MRDGKQAWMQLIVLFCVAVASPVARSQAKNPGKFDPVRAPQAAVAEPANPGAKDAVKPASQADPSASYLIGAGDLLGVNVWREPEMSQKLVVRPDGMISLPLIGEVPASGRTPGSLAGEISEKLKAFLTDPHVTVIVVEVHSKWFVVMGEVNKPGRFPLVRPITVMEALSEASGFREFAKTDKMYVLHQVNGKTLRVPFHYKQVVKGKRLNENIEVHDGDTIVVP